MVFNLIGDLLRKTRMKRKWTQAVAAEKIGVAARTLSDYENNKYLPRYPIALKIVKLFEELSVLNVPTPEELARLYWRERLSLSRIADLFDVSPSCILNWMRAAGIYRRTRSQARMKYQKTPFSKDAIEESYLLGFRAGDLYAYRDWNQVSVSTSTTHPSMINLFQNLFTKYGRVNWLPIIVRGIYMWRNYALLDQSFNFLVEKPSSVPKWILGHDEYFYPFLAGYTDAEGSFCISPNKNRTSPVTIRFSYQLHTCDHVILRQIYEKLNDSGFASTFNLINRQGTKRTYGVLSRDQFGVRIRQKLNVLKFVEKLLPHVKHIEKLRWMGLMLKLQNEKYWDDVRDPVLELRNEINIEVQECIENARKKYELKMGNLYA